MSEQDKQRIAIEQAKAWRSITTLASVAVMSRSNDLSFKISANILLDEIEKQKKRLDKFIDRIPD